MTFRFKARSLRIRDKSNELVNQHITHKAYQPLQHPIFLHGFVVVCVCISPNQWILRVQSPSLLEPCVRGQTIKPGDHTTTAITEMLQVTLNLYKK